MAPEAADVALDAAVVALDAAVVALDGAVVALDAAAVVAAVPLLLLSLPHAAAMSAAPAITTAIRVHSARAPALVSRLIGNPPCRHVPPLCDVRT